MKDANSMESAHFQGHRQRLWERFLKSGFAGFAEHEDVEILLTLCVRRRDVKSDAKSLFQRFGNLRSILDAPVSDLQQVPGIGEVAPVDLRVIRETANLYLQQQAEQATVLAPPDTLTAFRRSRLGGLCNEVFEVAYLASACKLIRNRVDTLEEGTVDRAAVSPSRVIEAALRGGAAALVCAHTPAPAGPLTPWPAPSSTASSARTVSKRTENLIRRKS
jgi:DNA repair protein RadC